MESPTASDGTVTREIDKPGPVFAAVAAVAASLRFLTALPVPRLGPADEPAARPNLAAAAWSLPVAGGLLGLFAGLVAALAVASSLPPLVAATLAVAALAAATGVLHEDGFADSLDALGGRDPARRLEIMRDSRIGTYGTAGLVLTLMLRAGTLAALLADGLLVAAAALVASGATARAAAIAVPALLPPARADGLGAATGRLPVSALAIAAAVAAAIAALTLAPTAGPLAPVAAVAAAAVATACDVRLAGRLVGGQTGDVAGAAAVVAELAFLVAVAAAVGARR
jgi:adenosylcobinamide-GDP ribazoletransferase